MTARDDLVAQFLFDRFNHSDFRWDEILEYEKDGWRTDAKEALRLASQQEMNVTVEQLAKDLREVLKPCPFCGNTEVVCCNQGDDDFAVSCKTCGASSSFHYLQCNAIATWNTRALTASAQGEQQPVWQYRYEAALPWHTVEYKNSIPKKAEVRPLYTSAPPAAGWDEAEILALADWLSEQQSYHDNSAARNAPLIQAHIERLRRWEKALRREAAASSGVAAPTLKELHQRAIDAVTAFEDAASVEETMWTGWGDCIVPPPAEMRRVKAQQALSALRDAQRTIKGATMSCLDAGGDVRGALKDCKTHRAAWRRAVEMALAANPPQSWGVDNALYWSHELEVFDRTFAALSTSSNAGNESAEARLREALEAARKTIAGIPASMLCDVPYDEYYALIDQIERSLRVRDPSAKAKRK